MCSGFSVSQNLLCLQHKHDSHINLNDCNFVMGPRINTHWTTKYGWWLLVHADSIINEMGWDGERWYDLIWSREKFSWTIAKIIYNFVKYMYLQNICICKIFVSDIRWEIEKCDKEWMAFVGIQWCNLHILECYLILLGGMKLIVFFFILYFFSFCF